MHDALVSIILPIKNGERFLEQALDSVFRQTYTHFELIVIDDGSTDRSAAIARAREGVRFLTCEGRGVASAWNTGIAAARARLVAFQAQDDLWLPDKLRVQVAYMQARPEVDYSLTRAHTFLEPGDDIPPGCRRELLGHDGFGLLMEALMVRKTAFDRIGLFNTELKTAQDGDWFARAADGGLRMGRIEQVLLKRRIHNANATFSPSAAREGNESLLAIMRASIKRKQQAPGP